MTSEIIALIPTTGDEVVIQISPGVSLRGEITDATDEWIAVRGRRFMRQSTSMRTVESIEQEAAIHRQNQREEIERQRQAALAITRAEEERVRLEREEAIRQRKLSLKNAFTGQRPCFNLSLISNEDMVDDEIAWYNSVVLESEHISRSTLGVHYYPQTSKGGVQWQGTCVGEDAVLFLDEFFEIIVRPNNYEINGSPVWRDLIELGLARVGRNEPKEKNDDNQSHL